MNFVRVVRTAYSQVNSLGGEEEEEENPSVLFLIAPVRMNVTQITRIFSLW